MACNLCGKACTKGGLEIKGACICRECESAIVSLQVSDPGYPLWIERVKRLWEFILPVQTLLPEKPIK
ncbi:MAG: inhibitor of sigma-G Gin [Firmicutes bacterium]|nr:inhibitor of sigma-G Gin [Bacillota bacterium]